jgi:hypothetical protein
MGFKMPRSFPSTSLMIDNPSTIDACFDYPASKPDLGLILFCLMYSSSCLIGLMASSGTSSSG